MQRLQVFEASIGAHRSPSVLVFFLDRRQRDRLGRGGRIHRRAHVLDRHVGVKFGRDRDGAVAQQRLHHFEVSGLAQRARSRGVWRRLWIRASTPALIHLRLLEPMP